jgi:protein-tyrosine-phosphatase
MTEPGTILFLCPHGAAKSVLAAAYFDRSAHERGLGLRAASAGTEPDDQPSPAVVAALREEGIDVSILRPRRVSSDDLAAAQRVISLGCDLNDLPPSGVLLERWDDVPPPSQNLEATRAAIRLRVAALVDELAEASTRGGRRP